MALKNGKGIFVCIPLRTSMKKSCSLECEWQAEVRKIMKSQAKSQLPTENSRKLKVFQYFLNAICVRIGLPWASLYRLSSGKV